MTSRHVCVLFRRGIDGEHEEEFQIVQKSFHVVERRHQCCPNALVIGRFSTLPFYSELQDDLKAKGSGLINSPADHSWIANMEWVEDLKAFTPKTWTDRDFHTAPEGRYVVKGRTNSRKSHWLTHMYAASKRAAIDVAGRLLADPLIVQQGLVYREFLDLVTYEVSVTGQPFTNEWRFFFLGRRLLTYGRYWTISEHPEKAQINKAGIDFAQRCAAIAAEHATFFVIDIAQKIDAGWVLIEVNEGQQAGLSENTPEQLWMMIRDQLGPDAEPEKTGL